MRAWVPHQVRGQTVSAYYNEIDPYAAQWLRNLIAAGHIAAGEVDTRSIVDVRPDDVRGFTQCHFFAGIAGWAYACRLAGWPDDRPIWTGSCPCNPFSIAGRGLGAADERHLWPAFFDLIRACRPSVVMGEQVEDAIAHGWLDEAFDDMEAENYSCRSVVLPACSVKAPHKRDRIWFVAYTSGNGCKGLQHGSLPQIPENRSSETLAPWNSFGDPFSDWEKLLAGTEVRRLDDGVSSSLAVRPALRCYGNAIVPQVAAEVIGAFMECRP